MAGENGATVQYSRGNDGRADGTVTLKEGETYFVDGDVEVGGWVKATQGDVQVELITGDIYDNYEVRFFKLLPKDMWSNSYTCPVTAPAEIVDGKTTYTCGNTIWIYNPNSTALTVTYSFRGNHYAMHEETLVVPAKSTLPLIAGKSIDGVDWVATERTDSGAYLTANAPFYAISTFNSIGTGASSLGKDKNGNPYSKGGDNKNWDWDFALVADNALSSQILVGLGLGLGCDPTSSKTSENGAPIWITAPYIGPEDAKKTGFNDSTKVYVKYDAATSEGKLTDNLGNPCDAIYTLHPLEVLSIYNESAKTAGSSEATNGQTGMTIWTTDGTRIAAAWGEDPEVATRSEPGIDMGTGIPPMPEILIHKDVELVKDADNDGHAMVGDTLEYTVTIYNAGRIGISEVYGSDLFDSSLSFVPGTFTFEGFDSDGNTSCRKRTLDDASFKAICDASTTSGVLLTSNLLKLGRTEPFLPAGGNWTFTYRTVIEDSQETIPNTAYAANKYTTVHSAVETPLRSKIGDYVWNDADKDGVQDEDEKPISGVKVTLKDTDGNVVLDDDGNQLVTTTDENGYYIFSGLVAGDYVVVFETPKGFTPTTKDAGKNDAADSDIDTIGKTGTVTVLPGLSNLTVDAGFYLNIDASIKIVKTAGEAADGDVWTVAKGSPVKYTYIVTNTGKTYLKDVTVNDDKLGYVGKVSGILAPGKSATLTKTAEKIDENVTNIGTVEGTPSDKDGTPVSDDKVTDDDDAVVEVKSGRIGDKVWNDTDLDGVQDENEMGVYNVTVELIDAETNEVIATTTTDATGNYYFDDVEPGKYIVHFVPSTNWEIVDADQGDDDTVDSDADQDGYTQVIDFDGGEDLTIDCGLVGGVPPGICEWIDIAYYFNAVIGGDFTANGGDTEGDLLVVGDATLGAGYSVGSIGEGYGRARDAADTDHHTLVVGGSLTQAGTPDHNGNIVYGGDYNQEGRTWGEGFTAREADPVTIDEEGNVPEDGTGTTLAEIVSDLTTFSEIASNLGETGNVVYDGNNWSGEAGFRNIFHVTDETFEINSLNSITITVPAGSKVLVNIYSESFTANMGSIRVVEAETGNEVDPSLVLFNFVNATEITTKNFEFPGSVLAPKAETSVLSGGSVNGFAFLNGDVTTYVGFEFHDFMFKAFDCSRSDVVTQRPVLDLVVTAEGDANGLIHRVDAGTEVRVNMVVTNPSDYDVKDVVLVDVLGNEIVIGDLPAGTSQSFEADVMVNEDGLYTATVSGYGVGTKAYDGVLISDADSVKFAILKDAADEVAAEDETVKEAETEASSEVVADAETSGESSMGGSTYVPRPDFEVVGFEFTDKPMNTKSTFSAKVTVRNAGETVVASGRIALYVDQPAVIMNLSEVEPAAYVDCDEPFALGETKTFEFTGVATPEAKQGIVHFRAVVDAGEQLAELSELNNQFPLAAWLVSVDIVIDGRGITLTWDSYAGQKFQVYASNDIKGFEPFGDVVEASVTGKTSVTFPLEDCEKNGKVYRFFNVSILLPDDL